MNQKLSEKFIKIVHHQRRKQQEYLEQFGLYYGQPKLLAMLLKHNDLTQSELVKHLNVSKETISNSVKRLAKSGHVIQTENPDDRRSKRITLTPMGKKVITECLAGLEKLNEELFSVLSEEQRQILNEYFDKILDHKGGPND